MEAVLDHSLCDGFRDPPPEWFIVGKSITSSAVFFVAKLPNNYDISSQYHSFNVSGAVNQ